MAEAVERVPVCELRAGDVLREIEHFDREVRKVMCYKGAARRDHVALIYVDGAAQQGLWIRHGELVTIKRRG